MKTLIIFISTTDGTLVEKARELTVEYLGTRTINKLSDYMPGALFITTILTPEEKTELSNILYEKNVGTLFIELSEEDEKKIQSSTKYYMNAKFIL